MTVEELKAILEEFPDNMEVKYAETSMHNADIRTHWVEDDALVLW